MSSASMRTPSAACWPALVGAWKASHSAMPIATALAYTWALFIISPHQIRFRILANLSEVEPDYRPRAEVQCDTSGPAEAGRNGRKGAAHAIHPAYPTHHYRHAAERARPDRAGAERLGSAALRAAAEGDRGCVRFGVPAADAGESESADGGADQGAPLSEHRGAVTADVPAGRLAHQPEDQRSASRDRT